MASQPKEFPEKFTDQVSDKARDMKDQIAGRARDVKDSAVEAGRKAADKIDEQREPSARALENAATTLHDKAGSLPGGEKVANIAHKAADKMQSTADYVRNHDVNAMWSDAEDFVRRYPGQMLAAAAVIGFLVGRAVKSDDY